MPIKRFPPPGRYPAWDPRGWPEAQLDPPTGPIPRVLGLDEPDERTPLYAALYAVHGLGGRHALNPHREVADLSRHADFDQDGVLDHLQDTADPTPGESAELPGHDYVHTDPVHDNDWPRITEPDDDDCPDCFPQSWSSEPTERDQAAIDAGNA